jgi:hypothetical protein
MKYAVYITRGDHWSFESRERFPILESEWLAYLASDEDFRPAKPVEARPVNGIGKSFSVELKDHWEWTGHPLAGSAIPTFQFLRAGLIVRAPDSYTLAKAKQVAEALKARIISDEEEVY